MNNIPSKFLDLILSMKTNGLHNYAIPGLSSHLIGGIMAGGVRLFECSRKHTEQITPHSHRFDFQALVLRGTVTNLIWDYDCCGDEYALSTIKYKNSPGKYDVVDSSTAKMAVRFRNTYQEGEIYGMVHTEIHSIQFSKNAAVLFFEGPSISDTSVILEPVVDGVTIPTFKTEPWMFTRRLVSE